MKNWIVAGFVICMGFLAMPAQAETIYVCDWAKISKPLIGFSKAYISKGGKWVKEEAKIEADRVTYLNRYVNEDKNNCGTVCEFDIVMSLVPYEFAFYTGVPAKAVNVTHYARNSCNFRSYEGATCKSFSPGDPIQSYRCRYTTK